MSKIVEIGKITFINDDYKNHIDGFYRKKFNLAVLDPPYGIGAERGTNEESKAMFAHRKGDSWDNEIPDAEYFRKIKEISKNQIIWGGNYFLDHLGATKCMIIWDKQNPGRNFADCEIAWTSFDTPARIFSPKRSQELNKADGGKIHPVQKPIALYEWTFEKFANKSDRIIDTHGGSLAIAVAAHKYDLHLIVFERDEEYFDNGLSRFKRMTAQQTIYSIPKKTGRSKKEKEIAAKEIVKKSGQTSLLDLINGKD